MVTVQLYGTDLYLEVLDSNITYIKTAGDLGEIAKLNSSYSWTMKFPKTPTNTQTLEGLGLVGSGSRSPYEKIYVNLLENGFPIVIKGLLNIQQTSDEYKIYIQEGYIDFLKDIANKTIGDSIDLSELDHERNYTNILASFDLDLPYAYLIADVNGKYETNITGTTNLNTSFMSPYVNIKYIWDKIFQTYGWTYDIGAQALSSIESSWMSYPSDIVLDIANIIEAVESNVADVPAVKLPPEYGETQSFKVPLAGYFNFTYIDLLVFDGINLPIKVTGNYQVSYDISAIVRRYDYFQGNYKGTSPFKTRIYINDNPYNDNDSPTGVYQIPLNEGDRLSLGFFVENIKVSPNLLRERAEATITTANLNLQYIDYTGDVSFTQALIKLKISDFMKEIMIRESFTPFVDSENRVIKFLTLQQRLSADYDDWSDKYVERKNESYLYQDYAQSNLLKHKYDDEISSYNDGKLNIDNANLAIEKDLYQSFTHSPDNEFGVFSDSSVNYNVPRLKMFDVEVTEDEATGDLIGKYKFIKDRFFIVKSILSDKNIYIDDFLTEGYPMVSLTNVLFKDIVNTRYDTFMNIANDAKVHDIDLALSLSDIQSLDLTRLKYFKQQAAYYILNRLQYKTGKTCTGNFLKTLPPLIFWNTEISGSLQKNDCESEAAGSMVTYTVPAFKYSSIVSQSDAQAQAQDEINTELTQSYANANGTCLYWNAEYSFYRTKDNCPSGYYGSQVNYTVPANTFSSDISQIDADLDAANFAFFDFTQDDANALGTCLLPTISSVENLGLVSGSFYTRRWQINPALKIGSKFIFVCYGVSVMHTVVGGDTALSIANSLILDINNTSNGDWNAYGLFTGGKPIATLESSDPVVVSVNVSGQPNFNLYVDNTV